MKKIILVVLIALQILNANAKESILTLAYVDNLAITDIDVTNEIKLINILKPKNQLDITDQNAKEIILNNLINESLKSLEIKKKNINIDENILNNEYNKVIINYSNDKIILPDFFKKKLYKKMKIDYEWNILINKTYFWKVSININEIENQLNILNKKDLDKEKIETIKNNLIEKEKEKKLVTYSNLHLKKIKEEYSIKIF